MKETFYLFQRAADGVWIFGNNSDCEHQAGICRPVPSTDRNTISIIYFQNNDATPNIYDIPVSNFLDEDSNPYANFAALEVGYAGFFNIRKSEYGVPGGCLAVTPHDTNLLAHIGWIEVRGNAGNVAIVDAYGNASLVLSFDAKELSKMQVSKVLATGTTATNIYLYY